MSAFFPIKFAEMGKISLSSLLFYFPGAEKFKENIESIVGFKISYIWVIIWKFITPVITIVSHYLYEESHFLMLLCLVCPGVLILVFNKTPRIQMT